MKQDTLAKIKWIQNQVAWTRGKPQRSKEDLEWLEWAEKRVVELRAMRAKELKVEDFL